MVEDKKGSNDSPGQTQNGITPAVLQNLEDAGCDSKTVKQFVELGYDGKYKEQLKLLEMHRKSLLEKLHKNERQIDCLDYLVYQIKKEGK